MPIALIAHGGAGNWRAGSEADGVAGMKDAVEKGPRQELLERLEERGFSVMSPELEQEEMLPGAPARHFRALLGSLIRPPYSVT